MVVLCCALPSPGCLCPWVGEAERLHCGGDCRQQEAVVSSYTHRDNIHTDTRFVRVKLDQAYICTYVRILIADKSPYLASAFMYYDIHASLMIFMLH